MNVKNGILCSILLICSASIHAGYSGDWRHGASRDWRRSQPGLWLQQTTPTQNVGELMKKAGETWSSLTEEEKNRVIEKAREALDYLSGISLGWPTK